MRPAFEIQARISALKRMRAEYIVQSENQRIVDLAGAWAIVSEASLGWCPSQNLNRVIDFAAVAPSDALLSQVKAVYDSVPRHFAYLEPCADHDLWVNTLVANDYFLGIAMAVLVGSVRCEVAVTAHVVRPVDRSMVGDLARALTDSTGKFAMGSDATLGLVGKPGATLFVAYDRHEPVAAAALTLHDGLAYLSNAYTRPEYRNRGAQTDLIRARLHFARDAGADTAFSETYRFLSSSHANLERCGLREAYQRLIWRYEKCVEKRSGLAQTLEGHPEL